MPPSIRLRLIIVFLAAFCFSMTLTGKTSIAGNADSSKKNAQQNKPQVRLQKYWDEPSTDPKFEPLENITYNCKDFSLGSVVKFQNGIFSEQMTDGNWFSIVFKDGAYGDLNGDGRDDAAAILISHPGGSGRFIALAIVMNQDGQLKNTDCVQLGGREIVKSIMIKPHEVTLDMLLHLSGEENCCPASPFKFTFKISRNGRITNAGKFKNIWLTADELAFGNIKETEKQYGAAVTYYSKAIQLSPQYEQAYLARASALMQLNRTRQAIRDYDHAIRLNQNNAEAYNKRAIAQVKVKNHDKAMADCDRAIQLDPSNAYFYYYRGLEYMELEKYQEAIKDLSDSINRFPNMNHKPCDQWHHKYEYAYIMRAQANDQMKIYKNAFKDLNTAINMRAPADDPNNNCLTDGWEYVSLKGYAYHVRGMLYGKLNNHQQSIKDLTEGIRIGPKREAAYMARGNSYFEMENYPQAIDDFTKAFNLLKPTYEKFEILIRLASAYYQNEDFEEARAYYMKALKFKPHLRDGINILMDGESIYYPNMKKTIGEMIENSFER